MERLMDILVIAVVVFAVLSIVSGVRILCARGFGLSRSDFVYTGFIGVFSVLFVVLFLYFCYPVYLNYLYPVIGLWYLVRLYRYFSKFPLK